MEPEQNESLFFHASKSGCNTESRNNSAKSGKCHRPGPLTRNPYFNFLRDFRIRNCGLTVIEMVRRGAKEWNAMSRDKKLRYIEEAFYAPKLHRGCCAVELGSKLQHGCKPKVKRKVSICRTKKRRSSSASSKRSSRRNPKSSICSSQRRSSRKKDASRKSSICSTKRGSSRRRATKGKTLTFALNRRGRKHSRKFKKSKCGQRKKLRKRKPKFGKSNCMLKAKKIKRVKRKRSLCDLCCPM